MKILFTTPVLEYPLVGGPALRIANSIKALNSISELHLLSRVDIAAMGGDNAELYYKDICSRFDYVPSSKDSLLNRALKYRFKTQVPSLNALLNIPLKILSRLSKIGLIERDASYISDYIRKQHIEIIWFGYGNISFELMKLVKKNIPEVKAVCDTDSVWSRFVLRELESLKDPSRRKLIEEKGRQKELEEKEWSHFMDITTAVSEVDAEYYRSIARDINSVMIFSNVVDLQMYSIKPAAPDNFVKPCIYLAGSFWKDSPMEQAARWVINYVLPLLRETLPAIHIYIIGRDSDTVLSDINDQNITITGKLDSVLPYLCNSTVSIVPLKFESGTRFKILEAGACGVPIVSTTLGAEGIPVTNGHDILLADDPVRFAESIIEILGSKELADKLTVNCMELIREKYSIDTLVREGEQIIHQIMN